MKKILLLFLGVMLVDSMAFGQTTNQSFSRNAVGYIKVTMSKGTLMMIQTPFENINGSGHFSIGELLGSNFPSSTTAYMWDKSGQKYISENFGSHGWNPGTNNLSRGEGLFLKIPSTAPSNTYDVFMMGEVPDKITAPTSSLSVVQGLQMVGFMYPVATPLTNTTLGAMAKKGDILYSWQTNVWATEIFGSHGWNPGNLVMQPGQAYFYKTTNATIWTETKPYEWP